MAFTHCAFCLKGQRQALKRQGTWTILTCLELTIILASANKMLLLSEHKQLNVCTTRIDFSKQLIKNKTQTVACLLSY